MRPATSTRARHAAAWAKASDLAACPAAPRPGRCRLGWHRPAAALAALGSALLFALPALAGQNESESAGRLSAVEIAERYGPAVVVISVEKIGGRASSLGSGFAVDSRGGIATCMHVLDGAREVTVTTADGKKHRQVLVRAFDAGRDVVLLAVDAADLPPLELGDSSGLEIGERLVTIGNPLGLARTVSEGVLSGWREPPPPDLGEEEAAATPMLRGLPGFSVLQISAQISPGSSGGPVFDPRGEVVGLAASGVHYGMLDLNFAIPVEALKALLDLDWGLDLESFQSRADGARADLAEQHLAEARLALALDRLDEAAWELDRALSFHPRSLEALLMQAGVLRRQGDFETAEELLQRATVVDPESAEAWYQLGEFYLSPALERPLVTRQDVLVGARGGGPSIRQRARGALEKALELDDDHASAAHGVGTLLFTEGRFREAADKFRLAIESDPDLLLAGIRLGESHMMLEEYEQAETSYQDVLDRDPDSALAHFGMARVSSAQHDLFTAREHWQSFLRLSEDRLELAPLRERTLLYLQRYMPEALPR